MLKIIKINMLLICFLFSVLTSVIKAETLKLVPMVDMQFSSWQGDNPGTAGRYDTSSGMITLGVMLQKEKWFGGLVVKSGQFDFKDVSPVEHDSTAVTSAKIERGESDLVVGYYFWPRIALFADFKTSVSDWVDVNYSVVNRGAGIGISGFYPVSKGRLYASFAFANLTAEADDQQVGKGKGSSLEFGWTNHLSDAMVFKVGIKSQTQIIDYDIAGEQTNQISGLVVGFSVPVEM